MPMIALPPTELTVTPVEGAVMERVLAAADTGGLTRDAFRRFDTASKRTAWAQRHFRRLALMDAKGLVASTEQYDLDGILDDRPVRIYAIGGVQSHAADRAGGQPRAVIARLTADAERRGADVVMVFGTHDPVHARLGGFDPLPTVDLEIDVKTDDRRGAPMILVRDGTDGDLPAIEAMGRVSSRPFRFHLDRDADFIKHVLTVSRLRAGLTEPGARQLRFVVAEEGMTASAYVIMSVIARTWTLESCGDRDPTGARVGAILQALIAIEPAEDRPVIRGWLPPGFSPPQLTMRPLAVSPLVISVRRLTSTGPPIASPDFVFWKGDVISGGGP